MRNSTNSRTRTVNHIVATALAVVTLVLVSHFFLQDATGAQSQEVVKPVTFSELYWRGLEHMQEGQPDSAVAVFERALERSPNHTRALVNLSRAYIALAQYDSAQVVIDKAIASDSTSAAAFLVLGRIKQNEGSNEEAISAYQKSIELNEHNPYAHNNLGLVYIVTGDYANAVASLEKAVEQEDGVTFFHNNLGMAYEGTGAFEQARESFQKALEIDPDHGKAQTNLARVESVLGIEPDETATWDDTEDDSAGATLHWDDEDNARETAEAFAGQPDPRETFAGPRSVTVERTEGRNGTVVASSPGEEEDGMLWLKGIGALALIIALAVILITRNARETSHRTA